MLGEGAQLPENTAERVSGRIRVETVRAVSVVQASACTHPFGRSFPGVVSTPRPILTVRERTPLRGLTVPRNEFCSFQLLLTEQHLKLLVAETSGEVHFSKKGVSDKSIF